MHLAEFVFGSASSACVSPHGEECTQGSISSNEAILIVIASAVLVYVAVSISNIVKKEPLPRRRNAHRPRRHSADDTAADRLEHAAQYTGDRERPLAWMDIGTITGKLTFGAWISRWWSSGSYMRRRLVVSIGTAILTVALLIGFVALFS